MFFLQKDHGREVAGILRKLKPGIVITDMHPLRTHRSIKEKVAKEMKVPVVEVDAHNIVPVWVASEKQEFAARTIRPKIHKYLEEYLTAFPRVTKQKFSCYGFPKTNWTSINRVHMPDDPAPVSWIEPGERAAKAMLRDFITHRLHGFASKRNDPNENALSNLSPYFHFGMLAPARAVQEVLRAKAPKQDKDAFVEEAVVRRELSDNYCWYQKVYDDFDGLPDWAKKTLDRHRKDRRAYIYSYAQFARAKTHDDLWNAAQQEMVQTGKMHGYLRMYWAKKILEWSKSPEDALRVAIRLNDRYELDGRDPNGYVGILWSIGGLHDRAWSERPIFGMVRYMNAAGCARKFDTDAYIARYI